MSECLPIACKCHMCMTVFERRRDLLLKGDAFCPNCLAPLSVANIVPLWLPENLTTTDDSATN
jgi:hypothetical protein